MAGAPGGGKRKLISSLAQLEDSPEGRCVGCSCYRGRVRQGPMVCVCVCVLQQSFGVHYGRLERNGAEGSAQAWAKVPKPPLPLALLLLTARKRAESEAGLPG